MQFLKMPRRLKSAYRGSNVSQRVQSMDGWIDRASADGAATAGYDHADTVKEYYNLCSDFMVFGWGESLHFAPLTRHESLEEAKLRHQRLMISKLDMSEGMSVADIGCGIGGPMLTVVREAGVRVTGINYSEVQLDRARALHAAAGIDHLVDYLECSFMDMSAIADDTFDRGYAIESTCHAPDKAGAFAEIFRVLKPGALLWGQEMCLTDKFDPSNDRHQAMKRDLMRGIALKDIALTTEVDRALEGAGFEIIEGNDLGVVHSDEETPWYLPMESGRGTKGNDLHRIPQSRKALQQVSKLAQALRIIPKSSADVIGLLDKTAKAYVAGGKAGIFTPLYCFLARKPE